MKTSRRNLFKALFAAPIAAAVTTEFDPKPFIRVGNRTGKSLVLNNGSAMVFPEGMGRLRLIDLEFNGSDFEWRETV